MQDGIFSNSTFSTLKYNGSPVVDRFTGTTQNQQLVLFTDINGNALQLNSITVEADNSDLYFTIVNDLTNTNYTNMPVMYCPNGDTVTIVGIPMRGVKFSNATGARYFIQGSTN